MKYLKNFLVLLILALGTANAAGGDDNIGSFLIHHVADSQEWHLPFLHIDLSKLNFDFFGYEVQVSLHMVMVLLAAIVLLILMKKSVKRDAQNIPATKFGHAIESVIIFIKEDIALPNIGKKHTRKWMPFLLTLFFFILTLNLIGLVPFMSTATANFNFTLALAVMVFVVFNFAGMKNNGVFSYIKNLAPHGLPFPVLIILFPIEIVGLFTKSAALAIRLFANMAAGHFIIFALLGMISVFGAMMAEAAALGVIAPIMIGFSIFIGVIEVGVAFLQAYVFTLLASLFIGSAINQEH